jgi:hypothetical protein
VVLLCGAASVYYVYELPAVVPSGCVQGCSWLCYGEWTEVPPNVTGYVCKG